MCKISSNLCLCGIQFLLHCEFDVCQFSQVLKCDVFLIPRKTSFSSQNLLSIPEEEKDGKESSSFKNGSFSLLPLEVTFIGSALKKSRRSLESQLSERENLIKFLCSLASRRRKRQFEKGSFLERCRRRRAILKSLCVRTSLRISNVLRSTATTLDDSDNFLRKCECFEVELPLAVWKLESPPKASTFISGKSFFSIQILSSFSRRPTKKIFNLTSKKEKVSFAPKSGVAKYAQKGLIRVWRTPSNQPCNQPFSF